MRGNNVMKHRARDLRRKQTEAEKKMWQHLRNREVAGCKFRRQQVIGSYIVDFVCLSHKLIIEVDGGNMLKLPNMMQNVLSFLNRKDLLLSDSGIMMY